MRRSHHPHRQVADMGEGVGLQRIAPLLGMLGVAPGGGMGGEVVVHHGTEGDGARGGFLGLPLSEGIEAGADHAEQAGGFLAGLRQRHGSEIGTGSAEAHLTQFAVPCVAEDPEAGAIGADEEIEAVAVAAWLAFRTPAALRGVGMGGTA